LSAPKRDNIIRRVAGNSVWLGRTESRPVRSTGPLPVHPVRFEILETEEAVGRAQFDELEQAAQAKDGDLVVVLLGGRGAQALHRSLGSLAQTSKIDHLLGRLHVFTQDALAPLRMENGLSFIRDFERLLGPAFFAKVKSFTSMQTDTAELEFGLAAYLDKLDALGGIDIFYLGLGPEANGASHLAYIKPGSGATQRDLGGVIPISTSIVEHHVSKFRAGGSEFTAADEVECRAATSILTLGPAAILSARRIVQSVVDASTAPAKRVSFRQLVQTELRDDEGARLAQLDQNPGLWLRLHPNVRSLILPDVLES